ncbi:ARF-binding protein [Tieghemiomyces parasiticus]|uniref:ARF-binding protein n=1 Tax=Tieghemiomyces parasiticus TaxID=78921 RepID=A0A9W8DPZ1_9FUNG|nr:ARF-binding protein [Tieghemiomyces parasiticus]
MPRIDDLVDSACRPALTEPDMALNLDVCDLINTKQQSCPHNAAVRIVKHINNRSQHVNLLALDLLDFCIKNCGHPFHYQIATKEFLEELVRKFPEPPPVVPTRVQYRILEMIQEWRQTICRHSRYKDDLVNIERLAKKLTYRGYILPEVQAESTVVLGPTDDLKSPEEKEHEDRVAMGAKLQELLRRGNAADLHEANRIMKIMSGYDKKKTRDYEAEWQQELDAIEGNTCHLAYVIQSYPLGHELSGEPRRLYDLCLRHQKKIQQMIQENENHEDLARLLHLNDIIGETLRVTKNVEQGAHPDTLPFARKPGQAVAETVTQTTHSAALIDLDSILDSRASMASSSDFSLSSSTANVLVASSSPVFSARPTTELRPSTSSYANSFMDELSGLDLDRMSISSTVSHQSSAPLIRYPDGSSSTSTIASGINGPYHTPYGPTPLQPRKSTRALKPFTGNSGKSPLPGSTGGGGLTPGPNSSGRSLSNASSIRVPVGRQQAAHTPPAQPVPTSAPSNASSPATTNDLINF